MMNLSLYFGPDWNIPGFSINGQRYYPGVMVRGQLGLKNSTTAIRHKVSPQNRILAWEKSICQRRSIHMITFTGVIELIVHSSTPEAKRIKSYLVDEIIIRHAGAINMHNLQHL